MSKHTFVQDENARVLEQRSRKGYDLHLSFGKNRPRQEKKVSRRQNNCKPREAVLPILNLNVKQRARVAIPGLF